MDRLGVLCFGGTYGLALASELARFVVRNPARWYATLGLTALAWAVQTAYLANLAIRTGQLPVTTVFESLLVLSWVLAAVGLYLIVRSPRPVAVGVFVLPVVIALVAVAGFWAPREDWAGSGWGGALYFWGAAHGLLYLVGAVGSCVAFAAGLMYLAQSHRLKHKRPSRIGFALPSLEQSERLNRAAIIAAFPFLTAGLLVGVVMELASRQAGQSRLSWTDPKVVSGLLMWLVFAGLVHARFRPEMRGRRVMLFTIIAFLALAFATVGVDLMHITSHGVRRRAARDSGLGTRDSGLSWARGGLSRLPLPPGEHWGEGGGTSFETGRRPDRTSGLRSPRPSPPAPLPGGEGRKIARSNLSPESRVLSPESSAPSPPSRRRPS